LRGISFKPVPSRDFPPKGLSFLSGLYARTVLPVYAIGGISETNIDAVRKAGAAGVCIMSPFMKKADPAAYIKKA
jgi:thiamine-phosphate pyrophosphorylase